MEWCSHAIIWFLRRKMISFYTSLHQLAEISTKLNQWLMLLWSEVLHTVNDTCTRVRVRYVHVYLSMKRRNRMQSMQCWLRGYKYGIRSSRILDRVSCFHSCSPSIHSWRVPAVRLQSCRAPAKNSVGEKYALPTCTCTWLTAYHKSVVSFSFIITDTLHVTCLWHNVR